MRGRSPYNKPSIRKKELYELLLKLGGESRWKNLKEHLKDLGWGPTTLKQTLDQLIEEKWVKKEARLGKEGAEVWYKTMTETDNFLLKNIVWKPSYVRNDLHKDRYEQWLNVVREEAEKLDGKEKESFLRDNLHRLLYGALLLPLIRMLLTLRDSTVRNLSDIETIFGFELGFDYVVKKPQIILLKLLLEYPEYAMEIIDQAMREPYKPPTYPPRSMKEFLKSDDVALQWVKSNYPTDT